jgi:hypothetical protein
MSELLSRHARLIDEKAKLRAKKQTPSTTVNYELTRLIERMVEVAKSERSPEVRSLLKEQAEAGHLGAEDALEWLAEEDSWWTGKGE